MKSYIIGIAAFAFLFCSVQEAFADIKEIFQKGAQVEIGDSINGRMLRFSTDGVLHTMDSIAPVLPSECRIVLQENDTVWMENMFPIQSEKDYHAWLKGIYIRDAKFTNPSTDNEELHYIFAFIPYTRIDYMEWTDDGKKYTCDLMLNKASGGNPPDVQFDGEFRSPDDEQKMESYIKFIIGEDMSLEAVDSFGEERKYYTTYYNYDVTCPYGVDLDKLAREEIIKYNGGVAYISNLKLTPILSTGK